MRACGVTFHQLAEYFSGTVAAAAQGRIEAHLRSGCEQCGRDAAWIQAMIGGMRAGQLAEAPYSLEPARALFRERMRARSRACHTARLVYDSRTSAAVANVRSGPAIAYQQLYQTQEHDIDLWCEPEKEGAWYVIGQALPREGYSLRPPERAEMRAHLSRVELDVQRGGEGG